MTAEILPVRIRSGSSIRFGVQSQSSGSPFGTRSDQIRAPKSYGSIDLRGSTGAFIITVDTPAVQAPATGIEFEVRMPFSEKLRYLLRGASSITSLVPDNGRVRSSDELAAAAELNYKRLMISAEMRIRD